jgi:hypothetical protein
VTFRSKFCRYWGLSSKEETFTPNGCGGKGGIINPPEWIFHEDCNKHDTKYHIGGTEEDRKKADDEFYRDMLSSISKVKWYRRPFLTSQAWLYYRAVRLCGKKFFNYRNE